MKESVLTKKSYQFAIRSVRMYQHISQTKKEFVLSKQCLRSGTSVAAVLCEAEYAQSGKDFVSKLSIAIKEANETRFWLRLLKDTDYIDSDPYVSMSEDVNELIKLLTASLKTAKKNLL